MPNQTTIPKQTGLEYKAANEDAISAAMVNELEAQLDRMYEDRKMLRQVHTKMHGTVKALFTVEADLPEELCVGVFERGKTYHAWVRFSNGNTRPKADKKKDVRGVAIKLMSVPGEKILNDAALQQTQDFLLMSSETFFSSNIGAFSKLLSAATAGSKSKLLLFALNPGHWGLLKSVAAANIYCTNPLAIPYWSTQPYQFGSIDRAVKYHLRPSPDNITVNENETDDNYLRINMAQTLNDHPASFDFYVQFQTDADAMPIEDPTIAWDSQFIKLATLVIPPQSFDTAEQLEFGDNLSFNSWHTLPAHRPLGGFNRVRKRVYETLSAYRHKNNDLRVAEPTDQPDFITPHPHQPSSIDTPVPTRKVVTDLASVLVNCNKETAFRYISSSDKLYTWLRKYGPVSASESVQVLTDNYSSVGAKRKVFFDNGDTVQEELISYHPFANYAYRVTAFSDFLKHFTPAAYGQLWFDSMGNRTRITWKYSYTYTIIFGRLVLWLFNRLIFRKYMQQSLVHAKANIENSN